MNAASTITVLVHGLWMHGVAMEVQRRCLARMGFGVVCYSYPSMRLTLTENAGRLARFALALGASAIHWVGHSMGGLVILRMLDREPAMPPGRVVLLGTPCGGCRAGDALNRTAIGARALGRSMPEWMRGVRPECFPGREIGVIAGSNGIGLGRLFARGLPVPHDGTVAVAETDLAAARDRIVLPVSHTSMLLSRAVAHQTGVFLREGRFDHRGHGR